MISGIQHRPIRQLNAEVARKIAAGEVIDRPNAIVRELLDNAVDSGADRIIVEIEGGGIDRIRVIDNGCGITEEDLALCARPHATSKITTETDLLNLTTLGFRGEALSSMAAVSRLSIVSGNRRMRASVTENHIIEAVQPIEGTIVQTEALFENFPARRQFLKRPAAETVMCRNTFIEKTLSRPDLAFRLTIDGEIKYDLPAGQSLTDRFVSALGLPENEKLFYEIRGKTDDCTFRQVLGEPSVYRQDKKLIFIFVNGRRITEFSLVQAIEYGCQGYFPNGTHPVSALFVQMDPSKVDFNIHPAKKEARFQDITALHHAVSSSVRSFFHQYTVKTAISQTDSPVLFENKISATAEYPVKENTARDLRSVFFSDSEHTVRQKSYNIQPATYTAQEPAPHYGAETEEKIKDTFHYIGTAFGLFLIAEKDSTLYIIDQHAAHERILFNRIMASQGKKQALLVPYVVETASEADDAYLESIQQELDEAGFSAKNCGNGRWEFYSIPERWQGSENDLSCGLLDRRLEPGEILYALAATSACKAAIKDGYVLDCDTAADIAQQALELPDPHCPHGRPVFTTLTREQLFTLVKRT